MIDLSVIVPCRDDVRVRPTIESLLATCDPQVVELIVVDDGSENGCCVGLPDTVRVIRTEGVGVSRAKNIGSEEAGGHWLAFCDAHMSFAAGWHEALCSAIEQSLDAGVTVPTVASDVKPDVAGCGMKFKTTDPIPQFATEWMYPDALEPVPLGPGACHVWDRRIFESIGRFADSMGPWGGEDLEISMRSMMLGHPVLGVPDSRVDHAFRASFAPDFDPRIAVVNDLKAAMIHFAPDRLSRVLSELNSQWGCESYGWIFELAATPEIFAMRHWMQNARILTDSDWFAWWND